MSATDAQRELADRAFEEYDFGDDFVLSRNGWRDEGDGELSQVFFLVRGEDESSREVFIVRFSADGSSVTEAFVRG